MMDSIPHTTFTPVTALFLAWFQQRVATLDAGALLFPTLDETILAQTVETSGIRDLVHGEIFSFDVACFSAS